MVTMERARKQFVANDLEQKMVFLSGPRQVGKTTLAKSLVDRWPSLYYLNFDSADDRRIVLKRRWDRQAPLVVFDEIHKWSGWKRMLKGVYDTEGIPPRILVTGSARLDLYRKGGDSLAGRYFLHRLLPLSVAELKGAMDPVEALDQLMALGGFPEPFLRGTETRARRWRKLYLERLLREDVRDISDIADIHSLSLLVELLRERVGSPLSFASLARVLQVSPHTVRRWLEVLESIYLVFRVTPYHRNIARAVTKEPKVYFYDAGLVRGDPGAVLENVVAVCLLKAVRFREDTLGEDVRLHYLRDREKREVDFVLAVDGLANELIEVKRSDAGVTRGLNYFHQRLPEIPAVQLVARLPRPLSAGTIRVEPAASWLAELPA